MNDSIILKDVKKVLNIDESDTFYDRDLLIFIATAFLTLRQLGVLQNDSPQITKETKWNDLINGNKQDGIASYIYLKVRLLFDPPTNSTILNAQTELIKELEFRLATEFELARKGG